MQGLKIDALQDFWERKTSTTAPHENPADVWVRDQTLLCGLRLNVLETLRFLMPARPTYEQFEAWIVERNGGTMDEAELDRLRRALAGEMVESEHGKLDEIEGLSNADLAQWDKDGYVVLKGAVSKENAKAAEAAIYEFLRMNPEDPQSWYTDALGKTIWVPFLRHPAIEANRRSPRIAKAFAQLWEREDLWATVDQAGLNPPERPGWTFPGPHLHWDTTLATPHYFGVQGILYLVDVAEDQGAFCCVPGFHKTLEAWLEELPPGVDARQVAKEMLRMKPIAASAGDMVLWHQSLPHGSSPNRAQRPRIVQYVSMRPTRWEFNAEWR
jgi:hypothetical protein